MDDWSFAESPRCSPREAPYSPTHGAGRAGALVAARGGSPTQSISADMARRLAAVEAETKSAELARRLADVQAEARLVAQTKQEVNIEFMRCKQTIERAYHNALAEVTPSAA